MSERDPEQPKEEKEEAETGAAASPEERAAGPAEAQPPAAAEEGDEVREAPSAPGRRGVGIAALALAATALVLVALAFGAGYAAWQEMRRETAAAAAARDALDRRLATVESRMGELRQGLEAVRAEAAALGQRLQGLRESLAELAARERGDATAWQMAEAEYLLRIANHRLRLAGDRVAALAALRAADERLRTTGDPAFLEVREAIAREVAALEAVAVPDLAGLAARLSALADAVPRLPARGARPRPVADAKRNDGERPPVHDVGGLLRAVWSDLRDLVRIRRDAAAATPLLAPEEEYFLRENLRLKLEGARLALLRGDEAAYRELLATARTWLERHFVVDDAGVQAALTELQRLAEAAVAPRWPDISGSLRLLTALGAEREG